MKKLKGSLFAKTLAVILLTALCLGFSLGALGIAELYETGYYSQGESYARDMLLRYLCNSEALNIARQVQPVERSEIGGSFLPGASRNVRYEIFDSTGELRCSTLGDEDIQYSWSVETSYWYDYGLFPKGTLWAEDSGDGSESSAMPDDEALTDSGSTLPPQSAPDAEAEAEGDTPEATPSPVPMPQTEQSAAPEASVPSPEPEAAETTPSPAPAARQHGVSVDPTPTPEQSYPPEDEQFDDARPVTPGDAFVSPGDMFSTPGDYYHSGRVVNFTVRVHILSGLEVRDNIYLQLSCFDFAMRHGGALVAVTAACLLLAILVFVFLMSSAGHRGADEEIKESFVDRIPFDIFTALAAAVFLTLVVAGFRLLDMGFPRLIALLGLLPLVAALLVALLWCMSFAVRVKKGTLIRGTLIYKILRLIWRGVKCIPLVWLGVLIYGAFSFFGFIAMYVLRRNAPGLWAFGCILLFPVVLWLLVCFRRLRDGAKRLASGDLATPMQTRFLAGELRRHAEDLNSIQTGMSRAVDARMRSEKMKTELITNVSHDIKTPLTSIINYVDLLSKEQLDNVKAQEYIEVLRRQSARLKKLTDDLVEASKASSGALGVNIVECDLGVMLDQTAGEYGERLAQKGLELIVKKPERGVTVLADVRHTQRIFDNLMSNILKYALDGTRVYLELTEGTNVAAVIFRNTSRLRIEQSAEELSERFVRGDSSRSTDGSGLGLSIAKSLSELQGGSLAVFVDGDLFKVVLSFRKPPQGMIG